MMEVIVDVCRAFTLIVSVQKTQAMCIPPPRIPQTIMRVEGTGQSYTQVQSFAYPEGAVTEILDVSTESARGGRHARYPSDGTCVSSTTSRTWRSPSRPY